ncbi:MAG: polyprenyl synthetase family protein [Clostridiales bacterium]|nr:polyprenyl synthetase family protein [Clostridiales bacterium]
MTDRFELQLQQDQGAVEAYLSTFFQQELPQKRLFEAMRYSLLAGGKRIRPVLAMAFCRLACGSAEPAMPFAAAVEMVHTYSLIHDDLPCMDNDDFRRGKPTNHRVFGEGQAVLAGDALLSAAFETLTLAALPAERIVKAVQILSAAAGERGMVGGQVLDLGVHSAQMLPQIHALKTGALIRAACQLGVAAGGGSPELERAAAGYAEAVGLAFQIRDDMLDVCGDAAVLGKPIGSDAENEKGTFASLYGLAACAQMVLEQTARAKQALGEFADADYLCWLAELLAGRER